jgi:hypothetical protein
MSQMSNGKISIEKLKWFNKNTKYTVVLVRLSWLVRRISSTSVFLLIYLLTYLLNNVLTSSLHAAKSFMRS